MQHTFVDIQQVQQMLGRHACTVLMKCGRFRRPG